MDVSRVFTLLCAILLVITLVLSLTTVFILKETVEANEKWQFRAHALLGEITALKETAQSPSTDTGIQDFLQAEESLCDPEQKPRTFPSRKCLILLSSRQL